MRKLLDGYGYRLEYYVCIFGVCKNNIKINKIGDVKKRRIVRFVFYSKELIDKEIN